LQLSSEKEGKTLPGGGWRGPAKDAENSWELVSCFTRLHVSFFFHCPSSLLVPPYLHHPSSSLIPPRPSLSFLIPPRPSCPPPSSSLPSSLLVPLPPRPPHLHQGLPTDDTCLRAYAAKNNWIELLSKAQELSYDLQNFLPLVNSFEDENLKQHVFLSLTQGGTRGG
jgi:hypothetical protein